MQVIKRFPFDNIDWTVDYYAGTIFIQAMNSPEELAKFLYLLLLIFVGKYLDEKFLIFASAGAISFRRGSTLTSQWIYRLCWNRIPQQILVVSVGHYQWRNKLWKNTGNSTTTSLFR